MKGVLSIYLQSAVLVRDVKKIGKMSVFVTFEHDTLTHTSPICHGEGKKPSWEDCQFDFTIYENDDTIQMIVCSKNLLHIKEIGRSLIWVESLLEAGGADWDWWEDVGYDGKIVGQVHLRS